MTEESTTPDLVALTRKLFESAERRDFDAAAAFRSPDAVWDASALGMGVSEGAAIRSVNEEWFGNYEEYENQLVEVQDLGNGVVFVVNQLDARPAGSTGRVRERLTFTFVWSAGMITRVTLGKDIHAGRAAAERLAQERG
jgi:ketosteroid isomerase-like protein